MSTIHAPDDDLDERWVAEHAHPAFAEVPDFDAPELVERAHANDPKRSEPEPAPRLARRVASNEETSPSSERVESGGYDHATPASEDERMGHELMIEEYLNSLDKPTEIEIEGSPFI